MKLQEWPQDIIRRASINNYGYGGTNAHAIIDNAEQYLSECGLSTISTKTCYMQPCPIGNGGNETLLSNGVAKDTEPRAQYVFVLSANSKGSLQEAIQSLKSYLSNYADQIPQHFFEDLAYTLCLRRTHFVWRSAVTASSVSELIRGLDDEILNLKASSQSHRIGFVFNGQGAAWAGMGCELLEAYPVFMTSLLRADKHFTSLGSQWNLIGKTITEGIFLVSNKRRGNVPSGKELQGTQSRSQPTAVHRSSNSACRPPTILEDRTCSSDWTL